MTPQLRFAKFFLTVVTLGLAIIYFSGCVEASKSSSGFPPISRPISSEEQGKLTQLLYTSIDIFEVILRHPNGIYRAGYETKSQEATHHSSIASVGVGLIALSINHELDRDPHAAEKAFQTLLAVNGKVPGLQIDRDPSGFFIHFFDHLTGEGNSEFSTIDTSILMSGALCVRNTFDDPRIHQEVDELFYSIDWPATVLDRENMQFYMEMEDGKGRETSMTEMFNEYLLLAWFVHSYEELTQESSDILGRPMPTWNYKGLELPNDRPHHALSSFVIQFPFYMMGPCQEDPLYLQHVRNYAYADWKTSIERYQHPQYWGSGAGGTPTHGYVASNFLYNPDNVISPRTMAGYLPVFAPAIDTLLYLLDQPERQLETPVGFILPRFSLDHPEWIPSRIESIDFSSMLFGTAAMHPEIGLPFFRERMKFTIPGKGPSL